MPRNLRRKRCCSCAPPSSRDASMQLGDCHHYGPQIWCLRSRATHTAAAAHQDENSFPLRRHGLDGSGASGQIDLTKNALIRMSGLYCTKRRPQPSNRQPNLLRPPNNALRARPSNKNSVLQKAGKVHGE